MSLTAGTVDIAVHKIVKDGVEEVISSEGLPIGGNYINQELEKTFETILEKPFVDYLKSTRPVIWLQLRREFEKCKLKFKDENDEHIALQNGLVKAYEEYAQNNNSIKDALTEDKDMYISKDESFLVIKKGVLKKAFKDVLDQIYYTVQKKLREFHPTERPGYIFLVGGLSQSSLTQTMLKRLEIVCVDHPLKVLIPNEPSLCVLRGAVNFGHKPDAITHRISKYTYAYQKIRKENRSSIEKPDIILKKGTKIKDGFEVRRQLTCEMIRVLYSTKNDLSSSRMLGEIDCSTLTSLENEVELQFIFGKSEFQVTCLNMSTGQAVTNNLQFHTK